MTRINRRQGLGLIGGAAAMTLSAPALAVKKKITVGALRFTSHSASFVAQERGYFADAGLDVEFKFFQAAQPMAVAIGANLPVAEPTGSMVLDIGGGTTDIAIFTEGSIRHTGVIPIAGDQVTNDIAMALSTPTVLD